MTRPGAAARNEAAEIVTQLEDAGKLGLPEGKQGQPEEKHGSGRASIWVSDRNPVDIADEIVAVVLAANDPPQLFAMGEAAVRIRDDGTLEAYDADRWLLHVARLVNFYLPGKTEDDPPRLVNPPAAAMRMTPKAIMSQLPVLDGIVHTPYLDTEGNLISRDGYHPRSRLVLRSGVVLPCIADEPSPSELAQAVKLLTDEWLGDFPFTSARDRANTIALLLTLTGRAFFSLAPLTIIDASTAGSGKGLLVNTISLIATGEPPNLMELPADGEEQRKKITTALLAGNDLIAWDESHVIAGRTLAMIMTAETYSDRLLGGNKMIAVRNRFTQVAIGNNVAVWGDMKRRVVPARLEPDDEHPEHRTGFRHPNLAQWVREHRGELLGAVLTIWRGWIAAGRPKAPLTMGSFERWAGAVGGALSNAGIHGFLDGTSDWLDFSDPDNDGWGDHLAKLHSVFGDSEFTVRDVVALFDRGEISLPHYKRDQDKTTAHVIGNMYRTARSKWWGRYRLEPSRERNSPTGGRKWTVLVRRNDANSRGTSSEESGVSALGVDVHARQRRESAATLTAIPDAGADTPDSPDRSSPHPHIHRAEGTAGHYSHRAAAGDEASAPGFIPTQAQV